MPEETQVTTPPAQDSGGQSQTATPVPAAPPDVAERLAKLEASLTERDELIERYKEALGAVRQQQAAPAPAATTEDSFFDEATNRAVEKRAEVVAKRLIDQTTSQLLVRSETQQKLGEDPELFKAADAEFKTLKSSPHYQGLPDYIVESIAVDRARANVKAAKYDQLKAEVGKNQQNADRRSDSSAASLPSTSSSRLRQPTPDNPDADLDQYMSQPESQQIFRKLVGNVDPFSDKEVKLGREKMPAKEAYKRIAIRAVRKGVGMSESLRGAYGGGE